MKKEEFLKEEFTIQINRFDKESTKHKLYHRWFRYTSFSLSGLATVFATMALSDPNIQETLNIAIVVITATAGVLTSIEGLRKPAELWIHERSTLYALKDLQREFSFHLSKDPTETTIDNYFDQLQLILGASKDQWSTKVQKTEQGQD